MSEKTYCIYKHTSPSGKSYIGQTNDFSRRIRMHKSVASGCTAFARAVKKYGFENFTSEILEEHLTLEDANNKERLYIIEYNSIVPNGYNLLSGGNNSSHCEETRNKIGNATKKFYENNPHERILQADRTRIRMATLESKEAFKERMSNPDVRKKANEKIKYTHSLPEARIAKAERSRIQMSSPEAKNAARERGISRYSTALDRARGGVATATGWAKKICRPFSPINYDQFN